MAYGDTLIEAKPREALPALARKNKALARAISPLRHITQRMFGLDYRSLALLRICLGLCLLWVTYCNAWEMRAFYTDDGVMPRALLFENAGDSLGFSLYMASGSIYFIAVLFALQFVFALMLTAGYRNTFAAIGSYVLLLSMQNRQPILLFGADDALRVGLFWMMFLPLGRRFSLDGLLNPKRRPRDTVLVGVAGAAFIIQVCMIYTGGALLKTGRTWTVDHTAVANALALEVYARPLGRWLGHFSGLTRLLTVSTLYFEMYGPLLFIFPIFSKWARLLGIVLFAGLQIGFGMCMTMGVFGPVMISLTLAFLPPAFWQRVIEPSGRWIAERFHGPLAAARASSAGRWLRNRIEHQQDRNQPAVALASPPGLRWSRRGVRMMRDGVVAVLLVVMVVGNIGNIPGQHLKLPPRLAALQNAVGLDQTWNMFAPDPQTDDGWFVISGMLRDGETVDLFSGARPVSYEKPDFVADSYHSQLWMAYLISLGGSEMSSPEAFTWYLAQSWDEGHSGAQEIEAIEIDYMSEPVWPGPKKGEVSPEIVWVERF